jgi:molybdate transport system substrate-binding protein
MTAIARWLVLVLIGSVGWPSASLAAEVKVLSAGATRTLVRDLAVAFQAETGHTVALTFGTAAVVEQKLVAGEPADVVIVPDEELGDIAGQGLVTLASKVDVGRSGLGVGVREGAPLPDVSTAEALKQTLLKAKSLVYVEGTTSGRHIAQVLQRLGIAEAVKGKTRLLPGGRPADLVASGEIELVVHRISEILPVRGVKLAGPLPRELQKVTTYSAVLSARSPAPELGRAFIRLATSPAFKARLAAVGLDYRE